jgi:hypothetical protein
MPKYNTIKEAILQSLEDLKTPQTANEICEHILVIPPKTEVFKSRIQHKPCTSVRGA